MINKAKEDLTASGDWTDDLKLEEAPTPSHILKSGVLSKRGEVVKNWKNRFIVVYNEKDNFRIDYHDGTDEKGKLKGSVFCAGYSAYEFDKDDIAEYGENGIKLVPWSWRRRTWYIKCNDDKEREEWLGAFRTACYKAKAPHDEDECIAKAFDKALQNTRWKCWIWGWYWPAGDEGERLGELVLDVLDREVINDVINGIVEGPAKAMTVDIIRKSIGTTVKSACSSAWISSASAVRSVSGKIQDQVKELISPVLEKQQEFKTMIVDKISGKINPFLQDKVGSLLTPVFKVIFKPIITAFTHAAKGFMAHMKEKISSNDFAKASFDKTLEYVDWQMDWYSGPVHDAYAVVWRMYTSDMTALLSILSGGITPYSVYNMVNDKLKIILHRAVHTFGQLARSNVETEYNAVLNHVMGLFFHDIVVMVKSTVMDILTAILSAPINELVIAPCQELVTPLQEMIEAIPIPGLSTLLDLPTMLEEVVGSIEGSALEAILSPSVSELKSSVSGVAEELSVMGLSLE
ncbi:hypothetical protein EON64_07455 [archaeon]|nr:MAG: hypothetical protein EON64_07455 [archaeon]